jgi:hypothetical protein
MSSKYALAVTRLTDELQKHLGLAAWLRATLESELYEAPGASADPSKGKRGGIDKASVEKYKIAVDAFEKLTKAKINLDKNAKTVADSMTPAEEREAVAAYIKSMVPSDRTLFLAELNSWHTRSA